MGCDIHVVLERKFKMPDGVTKWVGLHACPFITRYNLKNPNYRDHFWWEMRERSYDRFAKLAGVRGEGPDPRGLPEDASDLAICETALWESDGHSHSWCTLREALQIFLECERDPAEVFLSKNDFRMTHSYAYFFQLEHLDYENDEEIDTPDNYRLVFWFDN